MRIKSFAVVLLALLFAGCGSSNSESVSTQPSPSPEASVQPTAESTPRDDFQEALTFIRNGQFTYIWVFTRKDGKPFDAEDSALLRTKANQVVDWAKTDDLKKFVAGSNFPFEEQNLVELQKRFAIEDYSAK